MNRAKTQRRKERLSRCRAGLFVACVGAPPGAIDPEIFINKFSLRLCVFARGFF